MISPSRLPSGDHSSTAFPLPHVAMTFPDAAKVTFDVPSAGLIALSRPFRSYHRTRASGVTA